MPKQYQVNDVPVSQSSPILSYSRESSFRDEASEIAPLPPGLFHLHGILQKRYLRF